MAPVAHRKGFEAIRLADMTDETKGAGLRTMALRPKVQP